MKEKSNEQTNCTATRVALADKDAQAAATATDQAAAYKNAAV